MRFNPTKILLATAVAMVFSHSPFVSLFLWLLCLKKGIK